MCHSRKPINELSTSTTELGAPLKGNEKVGVVVPEYKLYKINPFIGPPVHLNDKLDELAVARMSEAITKELTQKGFTAVVLPANEKTAALLKRFKELPRTEKVLSDPAVVDLGDLYDLFKENGIDTLMLLDGNAIVPNSGIQKLTEAAIETAIALSIKSVVTSGNFKGAATTRTTMVDSTGKVNFYKEIKFVKDCDFTKDRDSIAERTINEWVASRK